MDICGDNAVCHRRLPILLDTEQLLAIACLTNKTVRTDLKEAAMWGIVFFPAKDYFMLAGSIIF